MDNASQRWSTMVNDGQRESKLVNDSQLEPTIALKTTIRKRGEREERGKDRSDRREGLTYHMARTWSKRGEPTACRDSKRSGVRGHHVEYSCLYSHVNLFKTQSKSVSLIHHFILPFPPSHHSFASPSV